jgi:hypothetical protein
VNEESRWTRFLNWLFPERLSETAKCEQCNAVVSKSRMVHVRGMGWFCNEDEASKYWWDSR